MLKLRTRLARTGLLLILVASASGCATKPHLEPLMPTPVLYAEDHINPFAHLPADALTTDLSIFYATNREPEQQAGFSGYGNGIGTTVHLGQATIRFGEPGTTWEQVDAASQAPDPRDPPMPLYLGDVQEIARLETAPPAGNATILSPAQQDFVAAINDQLSKVLDKQLLIYVHGARVDFYNACAFTAEVNHFAGRDLVGVAFAWPTHQNILAYASGIDVNRAHASAAALKALIELLAAHTDAEAINIISWSAGGRVASRALADLRWAHPQLDSEALRRKFRLNVVLFAAADVPLDNFLERLPDIHAVSERVTVFQSDNDTTLRFGQRMMGGGERAGMFDEKSVAAERGVIEPLPRVEIVDVSYFKERRGFDITGHHYWFEHPWVNTDVLLNVRTGLAAPDRGLTATDIKRIWGFPPDYPRRVGETTERHLDGQW